MKHNNQKMLGVTLLEILLVLAIAAMIIVMSIRYYQSATNAQQANMAMEEIQAITAAADNLAIGSGSYAASATNLASNVTAIVGAANMISPTNGNIVVGSTVTATSYSVSMPLTVPVCASVVAKLAANTKMTGPPNCDSFGNLTYTYNNTK